MIRTVFAAVLAIAGFAATPAAARYKVATYTGTITAGTDVAGLFGTAGADLTGLTFVATYTYDTAVGDRVSNASGDGLQGGTAEGGFAPDPFSDATLSIAGAIRHLPRGYYDLTQINRPAGPVLHELVGDEHYNEHTYNYISVPGLSSLDQNLPTTAGTGGGMFLIGYGGTTGGPNRIDPNETIEAQGTFDTQTLTISGSVPEPGTWALMVTGFGLIGIAVRRRHLAA